MFKKSKALGLKGNIILPLLVIIILGIALILFTLISNFTSTSSNLSEEVVNEIGEHYSNLIGRSMDSQLSVARSLVPVMEQAGGKNLLTREDVVDYLQEVMKKNDFIYGIYTCWEPNAFDGKDSEYVGKPYHDKTGRFIPYITRNGNSFKVETALDGEKDTKCEYYKLTKLTNNESILEPYFDNASGENVYMTSIAEPLFIDGKFAGIVGINILMQPLSDILDNINVFENGYAYLISANGQILSHPDKNLLGKSLYNQKNTTIGKKVHSALDSKKSDLFYSTGISSNEEILTTIVPLTFGNTNTSWGVGIAVPKVEVREPITKGLTTGIGVGVVVCTLAILLLFIITGRIVKRIYKINENLSQSSSFVSTAAIQLAATSQELADGSTKQAASLEETSSSMEETTTMVKQNAENTVVASELSYKTKNSTASGAKLMNSMIEKMKNLEESSKQISKIIKVIDTIAFQTNILALNAAIEAARAGEAGRGFSVVADEVRKLAQKSADAAKDTTSIIENNIELSEKAVEVFIESTDSLERITSEIGKVNTLVAEISATSEEQAKGVEQVTSAIENMDDVVQKNAAAAQESAAAAEELQAQSNELEIIVKELDAIVKGNKNKIDKIKKKKGLKDDENKKPKEKKSLLNSNLFNLLKESKKKKEQNQTEPEEEKAEQSEQLEDVVALEKDNEF